MQIAQDIALRVQYKKRRCSRLRRGFLLCYWKNRQIKMRQLFFYSF